MWAPRDTWVYAGQTALVPTVPVVGTQAQVLTLIFKTKEVDVEGAAAVESSFLWIVKADYPTDRRYYVGTANLPMWLQKRAGEGTDKNQEKHYLAGFPKNDQGNTPCSNSGRQKTSPKGKPALVGTLDGNWSQKGDQKNVCPLDCPPLNS